MFVYALQPDRVRLRQPCLAQPVVLPLRCVFRIGKETILHKLAHSKKQHRRRQQRPIARVTPVTRQPDNDHANRQEQHQIPPGQQERGRKATLEAGTINCKAGQSIQQE